ncbi:MAG TPA: 30S ribosomal protein S16 [Gammaproteobacteria bacterium]|nr:30S ribosomal protein S16 [Gammaproteobacteria bacterium]
MVTIRLARAGATNQPFYHVVVADNRRSRDGRFIERLGFYNPIAHQGEEQVRLDDERIRYWLAHGAKASAAVRRLLSQRPAQASEAQGE